MDQTTLQTIGVALLVMGGQMGFVLISNKDNPSNKKMVLGAGLSLGLLVSGAAVTKNVDQDLLAAEKKIATQKRVLKEKQSEAAQESKKNKKMNELKAKAGKLDEQIKTLNGVTVMEHSTNPFVMFALSRQAQNVKC